MPDVPATLMLLLEGTRVYGRCSGRPAFVLDGFTLRQALDAVRAEGALEGVKHVGRLRRSGRARRASKPSSRSCRTSSRAPKPSSRQTGCSRISPRRSRSAPRRICCRASYAPKSNWLELAKPWRIAASLLVAAGVLALVLQGAEYWSLRRADGALGEQLDRELPAPRRREPRVAVRRRGAATACAHAAPAAARRSCRRSMPSPAARNAAMRVGALSYRNQTMDLQLLVANVDELDAFAHSLEQTRRFKPTIESANQSEGGVEGRLQIVGAHAMKERWFRKPAAARARDLRRRRRARACSILLWMGVLRPLAEPLRGAARVGGREAAFARRASRRSTARQRARRRRAQARTRRSSARGQQRHRARRRAHAPRAPTVPNGIQVTFGNASFDTLVAWLVALEAQNAVSRRVRVVHGHAPAGNRQRSIASSQALTTC